MQPHSTAVNLLAMILLVNDKHALSKPKLLAQLEFYLRLQREASYSNKITAPDETPEQLLEHALKLNKFDVISDEFGEIIAINDKEKVPYLIITEITFCIFLQYQV